MDSFSLLVIAPSLQLSREVEFESSKGLADVLLFLASLFELKSRTDWNYDLPAFCLPSLNINGCSLSILLWYPQHEWNCSPNIKGLMFDPCSCGVQEPKIASKKSKEAWN